ncbi:MAG TPA: hypothetical protein VFT44_13400, partial [Pyrinomonadaceae bacterium]|nr:hypothetical protein [Pyrinomonadaceae bacterium]
IRSCVGLYVKPFLTTLINAEDTEIRRSRREELKELCKYFRAKLVNEIRMEITFAKQLSVTMTCWCGVTMGCGRLKTVLIGSRVSEIQSDCFTTEYYVVSHNIRELLLKALA